MNLVLRCMFRWFVGLVFGLVPALVYYLYAQAEQVFHDDVYYSRLTLAIEAGCVVGAIGGAIWAARLLITAYEEGGARRRIGGP
jgi:hypothetical protein